MKPDITLIFPTSPFLLNQQVFPPLGILYLSAWLKQGGWKVECRDMGLGHDVENVESKVVGISITTPQRFEAYKIAKNLRSKGHVLIAGGPHATHMPQECLNHGFDYVIRGQGEVALDAALLFLTTGKELDQRIIDNRSLDVRIDDLPAPDRDAVNIHQYEYKIDGWAATTIMTSRGCPYNCSFCARVVKKCYIQSAERTLMEIDMLGTEYGFTAFMIFDDVFIVDKKRTRQMADFLEGKGYTFRCFARANLIDPENVALMKRMGVVEVGIGVESGSDDILRKNLKGTTREINTRAVNMLHDAGIRAKAFLIIGLPGESVVTIADTISWVQEAKPFDIDVSVFQPLPGSPIFDNPSEWDIKFEYDGALGWYKGTPGEYESVVSTSSMTPDQIVRWRDYVEGRFKRKEFLR